MIRIVNFSSLIYMEITITKRYSENEYKLNIVFLLGKTIAHQMFFMCVSICQAI